MEELEWARILIKSDGANTPGSLVIGIEEISYSLSLWWESVPVLRQEEGRKRCLSDRLRGEREGTAERVFSHVGQLRGPDSWAGSVGPSSLKNQAAGPSLSPMGDQFGLRQDPNLGRATVDGLGQLQKGKSSLNQAHESRRDREKATVGPTITGYREDAGGRSCKEGYDHSRMQREGAVIGSGSRNPNVEDRIEKRNGCWDLVEINSVDLWEENWDGWQTRRSHKRKRKEKIIGKGFLEALRFERELKRLESSVNYEREAKKKRPYEGQREPEKGGSILSPRDEVQVMSDEMVRSLGPGRYLDWKRPVSISCRFRNEGDGAIWVFTGVYGPFSREDREGLWEELGAIRGLWEEPWCLGGDFNITLYIDDRNRTGRITSAMRRFAQIIDELGLVDIPLQGGSFTWSGGLNNQTRARLDRFLAPLVGGGVRRGPSPFKFENMWLKAEGFQELIKGWWQGIEVSGRPSYRLATKLKGLKQNLKTWNKEVFGRLEKNKADALQQVESWDSVEEMRSLTEVELNQKKEAKESYEKWCQWKKCIGGKGSRYEGRNSKRVSADPFGKSGLEGGYRGLLMNQISPSEADGIEVPFSETEIFTALKGMNGDKARARTDSTLAFWQNSWETVKEDLLGLFKEFHDQNSFIKSLNHTFLVLIPKKGGVEELGDYRPISLLGGLYKLLAKVLANRIKKVIGKVISLDQNAFIKGRQILDGSLIANEVIDLWQKRGEKGIVCKLDIEKAYDSINWQFLLKVMQKMGFGSKWIGWMWYCISTVKYSVLVNGVPAGFFQARKGRWMGCWIWRLKLDVGWGQLPTVYLGLPLGAPNRDVSAWDGVEERTRRRLSLWKRQYLSKGVARRIEKLQRVFLWGGTNGGTKSHLVKWEAVCVEKEKGGLGLRKITILNKALLGKWIWRFACAKEEFWKKVLEAKYGKEEFGWRTRKANGAFGVGCAVPRLPEPFSMAAHRNVTVEECWDQNTGQGGWILGLLRDLNDWEVGLVGNILAVLRDYSVTMEDDAVCWKKGEDGLFKIKYAYNVWQTLMGWISLIAMFG
ncbi:Transposon TX1 uncharacterized 149 kDa protein [Vitis vinifera]|uniref:Transposon TX1 uncharacterized 149 kDa protein n=1 Tax=Vitis vinifera TaxID=29760 RepID=A0A438E1F0_VITVI|nr:Transposon TX1 uncharacterized 149 kDa protein [Vitis vinifera]